MHRLPAALGALPKALRIVLLVAVLVAIWAGVNWAYHVVRKPSELFFPVSGALGKSPAETWRTYGHLFTEKSTRVMTPELLAALAQAESAGNPVARTYWRWRPSANPLAWYQPASSAVGLYQITDGTFEEARRYCIREHVVVDEGSGGGGRCGNTRLYTRVVPSHAIELTAARLDRRVAQAVAGRRRAATRQQQQDLAVVIHLCGPRVGAEFVARGFRPAPGEQCGDHDLRRYLAEVNDLKREFARLSAGERLQASR